MKGEACAHGGGSAHEAEAPREDEFQLLNTADLCDLCGASHHPCPCWLVVLSHTLLAPCCRGCASLPQLREAVTAHLAGAHSRQEKQCPAHCRLPGEPC